MENIVTKIDAAHRLTWYSFMLKTKASFNKIRKIKNGYDNINLKKKKEKERSSFDTAFPDRISFISVYL